MARKTAEKKKAAKDKEAINQKNAEKPGASSASREPDKKLQAPDPTPTQSQGGQALDGSSAQSLSVPHRPAIRGSIAGEDGSSSKESIPPVREQILPVATNAQDQGLGGSRSGEVGGRDGGGENRALSNAAHL